MRKGEFAVRNEALNEAHDQALNQALCPSVIPSVHHPDFIWSPEIMHCSIVNDHGFTQEEIDGHHFFARQLSCQAQ